MDGEWCIVMTGRDDDEDKCRYMAIDKATHYASVDGMYFVDNWLSGISNNCFRSIITLEGSFLSVLT